jgi:tetratricopeptide (TPR) repeat protein
MWQKPDSALQILEALPPSTKMDKLNHATWCLLLTQAQYRAYKEPSNDSILSIAYRYFANTDDSRRKALSMFLEGVLRQLWGGEENADYQYWLDASKEAEKCNDYLLSYQIYSNMSQMNVFRNQSADALENAQKAIDYAKLANDKMAMATAWACEARAYTASDQYGLSIQCYEEALTYAKESKDANTLILALTELAERYAYKGYYQAALDMQYKALHTKSPHSTRSPILFTIGNTYRLMHEKDSANYYLNKVIDDKSLYVQRSTNYSLYLLYKDQYHEYGKAMNYLKTSYDLSDSLQKIEKHRDFIEMQAKYKSEQVRADNAQLKVKEGRMSQLFLLVLSMILTVSGIIVYIYQRRNLRKSRIIQEKEEKLRENAAQLNRNKSEIEENLLKIELLNKDLEQYAETEKERLESLEKLQEANQKLEQENEKLKQSELNGTALQDDIRGAENLASENETLRKRIRSLYSQRAEENAVLNRLRKKPSYQDPKGVEWQRTLAEIDVIYDHFSERLLQRWNFLSPEEVQLCGLIKLRTSLKDTADIMGLSPEAISKRKTRLLHQIQERETDESLTPKELQDMLSFSIWLQDF